MMATYKQHKRRLVRSIRKARAGVRDRAPDWLHRALGPAANYLDMLFVDHGIFRVVYANRHRVGEKVWRSSQPAPHQIRHLARSGLRTIVNLRGDRDCGSYRLERALCAEQGIALVNFKVRSRAAPTKEELHAARELFAGIEYPMLMHCKAGADRVGLMSVLYLFLHEGRPLDEAMGQLSVKFGHVRQADTGVLDFFFEQYQAARDETGIGFFDWVDHHYDPDAVKANFRANGLANTLVNRVLARE